MSEHTETSGNTEGTDGTQGAQGAQGAQGTDTQVLPTEARVPGRHPVNTGHLVMGIAFLGLALIWTLIAGDVVTGGDVRWLLPLPWVAAGLAGVLATLLPRRRVRPGPAGS